jgi:hypothetical protein
MMYARWSPTCTILADGRVLVMAGLTNHFPWVFLKKLEVYSEDKGWQIIRDADRRLPPYPCERREVPQFHTSAFDINEGVLYRFDPNSE